MRAKRGFTTSKMGFFMRIWTFILFSLRATLKACQTKCDVIYATSTPLTIAIPGVLASKYHKVPMVFEVRDLWPEIPIALKALKSPMTIYLARKLEQWAYKNSKRIVALSPGMADGVAKLGYPKDAISIIPNFSDVDMFSDASPHDFRVQNQWLAERRLVVYTGTFGKVNGLAYLVEVASAMLHIDSTVCFVLIGDGAEKNDLENLAIKRGVLNTNLYFLPPVSKCELPNVLAASDICVSTVLPVPELWHNSANKFFDALAAGKPVAINHYGWQADAINDEGIGVVMNPESPKDGALSLSNALSDNKWLADAGRKATELARNKYSLKKLVSSVEVVLKNSLVG
ncbi:MAG: glycosyltransferase involved in cell wall biosynthesis [bacterium]|jgi:glycosyltransferase involved in cell wall biosynthesis